MKTRLALASPLIGLVFLFVSLPSPPETAPGPENPLGPFATQHAIVAQLAELSPGSAEAQALRAQLDRVRRKAHQSQAETLERKLRHGAPPGHPYAENPGAFHEAMAEIKTTKDGRSYPPNYKITALRRAREERRYSSKLPLPWIERGPGNVAGRSRAIVVDPDDLTHNTWFVATVGGGIWKTSNGGGSWVHKTPQLTTLSTTCLAMCAGQPEVMYAGTGMGYGRIVDLEGSGIWKSIDRGESWTQLASTANGQILAAVNRIVVDPVDPDVLVVCTNDVYSHLGTKGGVRKSGIFKSIDGGASFTQVYDSDLQHPGRDARVQQIVAHPQTFNALYATVNEVGVIRSIDAGDSWFVSADNFALPGDIGNPPGGEGGLAGVSVRTEMAIAPNNPSVLYAAVERPRGVADLFLSLDGGDTWTLVTDTSGDPNWFNAFGVSGNQSYTAGWFDNTIAVSPFDPLVVYVGGVNLYRIQVNPANFTRTTTPIAWWAANQQGLPYSHADHHWLEIIPIDEGQGRYWVLDANDGGLAISRDQGVNWTQYTGLGTTQFYGADKRPGVDAYFGGMQDNGSWHSGPNANANSQWSFDIGGDGFEVAWNALRSGEMLGGSQFGNLSKSSDFGNTWNPLGDIGLGNAPFITKIANSKTDPDLVFSVGSGGIARSDDFGTSWTLTPILSHWVGWRPFANVEVHDADPQLVWITSRFTRDPLTNRFGGVHLSQDGGLSYADLTNNLPNWVTESSGLGMHPTDPATAYLLFSAPGNPKVLRTMDYGASWEDISGFTTPAKAPGTSSNGFPDVATFTLLPMPYDPTILWAGTEVGLFISPDNGASWSYADNGLPPVAIFELSVVDDEVIAATQGRGIWSVQLTELAGYTPPVVTLSPRLQQLTQSPSGKVDLQVDLRSPYDQTEVWVNGVVFATIAANAAPRSETIPYPVTQNVTLNAYVVSTVDGREYRTPLRSLFVRPVTPRNRYVNDFDDGSGSTDFTGSMSIRSWPGFTNMAAHGAHPYPVNQQLSWTLNHPILVDEIDSSIRYKDVAIVEEGVASDYTDPNFWDYVIVEATRDGVNWLPLIAGYDSRANPLWLNADRTGGSGTAAMYVQHELDFKPSFVAGDLVFVRFRLFSDPGVVGWGWVIDDLEIQSTAVGIPTDSSDPESELPSPTRIALMQNYPNPFNPSTTITYELPEPARVRLVVYDLAGRRVRELVSNAAHPAGSFDARWDGRDEKGGSVAAGTYFYRLDVGSKVQSRKMTLVK